MMKFAHELKEALRREGFPPHWIESAVPYGLLKKSIKRVEAELKGFGLDADTLRQFAPPFSGSKTQNQNFQRYNGDAAVAFQYKFAQDPNAFRPTLTLYVQLEDGVIIGASLSPSTKAYLTGLAAKQVQAVELSAGHIQQPGAESLAKVSTAETITPQEIDLPSSSKSQKSLVIQQIEVPLVFDAEFFDILQGDVTTLDTLHAEEHKAMTAEIVVLSKEIARVTNPTKRNKTDLDRWRELFDIYLQAGVFFSTNELDHGTRNSTAALKQLQWFQAEVVRRGIVKSFKVPASREAFNFFTSINVTLLRNIKFQEINQLAISKILKKFDKRTSLGAKDTFPRLIQSDKLRSETMAKAVCSEMSKEIVKIVPQLDDYLCPVCFSISYKPVRLTCNHVFCIRCMIRMQKAHDNCCPLCRNNVVMHADSANIDASLMRFLRQYFPKETKAKQKENEIAAGVDLYGETYADAKCIVM